MLPINEIYFGDCLDWFPMIDDNSVDLIILDPPYNIKKAAWDKIIDYVPWMGKIFKECERVLKDNGSFYFFHNDFLQTVELQNWLNKNSKFVFKQLITWNKIHENFYNLGFAQQRLSINMMRNYYNGFTEYILFYTFQDETGSKQVYDNIDCFKTIKQYLRNERDKAQKAGFNDKDLRKICNVSLKGGGLLCHYWGNAQWMFPPEHIYKKLQITGFFIKEYESLRQEYESLRYTFNSCKVKNNLRCNSNMWLYPPCRNTKHLTQKPISLIKNIILHSSNENDLILDPMCGSGTTLKACEEADRNYIGIEMVEEYYNISMERMKQ